MPAAFDVEMMFETIQQRRSAARPFLVVIIPVVSGAETQPNQFRQLRIELNRRAITHGIGVSSQECSNKPFVVHNGRFLGDNKRITEIDGKPLREAMVRLE